MLFKRSVKLASHEEALYRPILLDWFGSQYRRRLVSIGGKIWFVKCKNKPEKLRDRLASILGQGWLNIAAVECLDSKRFRELRAIGVNLPDWATHEETYLVRFGPNHRLAELPIRDPDLALASEIVFSIWLRRRDAHSFNRIYVSGVPLFFDCGVGFLLEPQLEELDNFFQAGPDPGYAGLWRIKTTRKADLETLKQRRREINCFCSGSGNCKVFLPVVNSDRFFKGLTTYANQLADFEAGSIKRKISHAGFDGGEENDVFEFLKRSSGQLRNGLGRLNDVLIAPSS